MKIMFAGRLIANRIIVEFVKADSALDFFYRGELLRAELFAIIFRWLKHQTKLTYNFSIFLALILICENNLFYLFLI